jgi:hypothetical protein
MSVARPSRALSLVTITLCLLMAIMLGGCRSRRVTPPTNLEDATESNASPTPEQGRSSAEARFPRRLLFINISNYVFQNPLMANASDAPDRTRGAALRLAHELKVPSERNNNQVFLLSDTAPPPDNKLPTRSAIVWAYERFFDTSGPRDRIIVYFGGHAIEVDGNAYIVPIEGDRNDPKLLISIEDFYANLKACKAVQKVVIWDVCRFNPERGQTRPGSESMTPSLSKALTAAPEGVEVVTTCQVGENALEFNNLQIESAPNAPRYSGSAFLESIQSVADKNRIGGKPQTPTDPIPVAELITVVGKRVAEMASSPQVKLKQTVRYFATRPDTTGDPNPGDTATHPPISKNNSAEILAIVEEFRVPPLKTARPSIVLTEFPFRDEVIAAYKSDVSLDEIRKNKQKYEFRIVTLNAFQTLRDVWVFKPKGGLQQREYVAIPIANELKKEIKKELDAWGIGIAKLEEVDIALEKVAAKKKDQPRRWQAHYDYARAVVKFRLAFMNEYDKLMGDVLTETLPPLDKTLNQNSYRLVSSEKMKSKKDIQKLAADAQDAYTALIAEYKDTPWAIQAEFEKNSPIGLIWQPINRAK